MPIYNGDPREFEGVTIRVPAFLTVEEQIAGLQRAEAARNAKEKKKRESYPTAWDRLREEEDGT